MADFHLASNIRSHTGKKLKDLRSEGLVPGVVYGQGKEPTLIQVDEPVLAKTFSQAGTNQLIELAIDKDKTVNVLFHEIQRDPMTQRIRHFDFYTVRMDEKIKTEVPIHFLGEAPAVHKLSAILVKNLETIEVEALPVNLPENIEVDLSGFEEIGDAVHVRDLAVPNGVEFITDPETLIVKTDPPRSEEELAELEEEVEEGAETDVAAEHGSDTEGGEAAEGDESEESKGDEPKSTDSNDKDSKDKKEDQSN